jgi:hypothetical protein
MEYLCAVSGLYGVPQSRTQVAFRDHVRSRHESLLLLQFLSSKLIQNEPGRPPSEGPESLSRA